MLLVKLKKKKKIQGIRVGMSIGMKIKGNERIYKNIVLTFWYEKLLKKTNLNTDFYFSKCYFILTN